MFLIINGILRHSRCTHLFPEEPAASAGTAPAAHGICSAVEFALKRVQENIKEKNKEGKHMRSVIAAAPGAGCLPTPAGSGGRRGLFSHPHFAAEPLHQSREAKAPPQQSRGSWRWEACCSYKLQQMRAQRPQEDNTPSSML